MTRVARIWWCSGIALLSVLAGVAVAGCLGPAPDEGCGFGERLGAFGCAPVDHLHVNFDERRQELNGTSRSGIGVNACAFRAVSLVPTAQTERCSAWVFEGQYAQESYAGSGGGILAELDEPVQMAPSPVGEGCYDTDLHPSRSDLFAPGDTFEVLSLGGAEFPPFDVELTAPESLELETPDEVKRSEALALRWEASDADVLSVLLWAWDEEEDTSTNVACFFDDEAGEASVPAEVLGELQAGADVVDTYFYRQAWVHLEPEDVDTAIDVVATSSVTRRATLVD